MAMATARSITASTRRAKQICLAGAIHPQTTSTWTEEDLDMLPPITGQR